MQIAQAGVVGEEHPVERREERRFVEARRRQLVPAALSARRAARFERCGGLSGWERGEPCLLERGRRNRGDLVDPLGEVRGVEAGCPRERRIGRVVRELVCEEIAREGEKRRVAQRVVLDRAQDARVEDRLSSRRRALSSDGRR
jgi:hypothetical protein